MRSTTLKGDMHQFTAKAPKPDKAAVLVTKLCITTTAPATMAALFKQPSAVKEAIFATMKAGGKIELPCDGEEAILEFTGKDGELHKQVGVAFDKVVCDFSGEVPAHEVHYTAPFSRESAVFSLDSLGLEVSVTVTPAQRTFEGMDEKPDAKAGKN